MHRPLLGPPASLSAPPSSLTRVLPGSSAAGGWLLPGPLRARGSQADTTYTCPPNLLVAARSRWTRTPGSSPTTPHSHTRHQQPPAEAPSTPDVRRSLAPKAQDRQASRCRQPGSARRREQQDSDHRWRTSEEGGGRARGSHAHAHSTRATFSQECFLFQNLKARGGGGAKTMPHKTKQCGRSLPEPAAKTIPGLIWAQPSPHHSLEGTKS